MFWYTYVQVPGASIMYNYMQCISFRKGGQIALVGIPKVRTILVYCLCMIIIMYNYTLHNHNWHLYPKVHVHTPHANIHVHRSHFTQSIPCQTWCSGLSPLRRFTAAGYSETGRSRRDCWLTICEQQNINQTSRPEIKTFIVQCKYLCMHDVLFVI